MTKQTPNNPQLIVTELPGRKRDRIRLVNSFPGLQSEVARLTGCRRSSVSNVVHKRDASRTIEQALIAGLNRRINGEDKADGNSGM